jgi:hypothetical protein
LLNVLVQVAYQVGLQKKQKPLPMLCRLREFEPPIAREDFGAASKNARGLLSCTDELISPPRSEELLKTSFSMQSVLHRFEGK